MPLSPGIVRRARTANVAAVEGLDDRAREDQGDARRASSPVAYQSSGRALSMVYVRRGKDARSSGWRPRIEDRCGLGHDSVGGRCAVSVSRRRPRGGPGRGTWVRRRRESEQRLRRLKVPRGGEAPRGAGRGVRAGAGRLPARFCAKGWRCPRPALSGEAVGLAHEFGGKRACRMCGSWGRGGLASSIRPAFMTTMQCRRWPWPPSGRGDIWRVVPNGRMLLEFVGMARGLQVCAPSARPQPAARRLHRQSPGEGRSAGADRPQSWGGWRGGVFQAHIELFLAREWLALAMPGLCAGRSRRFVEQAHVGKERASHGKGLVGGGRFAAARRSHRAAIIRTRPRQTVQEPRRWIDRSVVFPQPDGPAG